MFELYDKKQHFDDYHSVDYRDNKGYFKRFVASTVAKANHQKRIKNKQHYVSADEADLTRFRNNNNENNNNKKDQDDSNADDDTSDKKEIFNRYKSERDKNKENMKLQQQLKNLRNGNQDINLIVKKSENIINKKKNRNQFENKKSGYINTSNNNNNNNNRKKRGIDSGEPGFAKDNTKEILHYHHHYHHYHSGGGGGGYNTRNQPFRTNQQYNQNYLEFKLSDLINPNRNKTFIENLYAQFQSYSNKINLFYLPPTAQQQGRLLGNSVLLNDQFIDNYRMGNISTTSSFGNGSFVDGDMYNTNRMLNEFYLNAAMRPTSKFTFFYIF